MEDNEDHRSHIISSLEDMRSRGLMYDFKIKVGSITFKTHRLILAANSEYFKELFSRKGKLESVITMENIEPTDMQQCIQYMYTSKCKFKLESVPKLLDVARLFQIPYFEEDCWNIVLDNLNPDNSLFVLNLSKELENPAVQEAAEKVIQDNLEIVMSSERFLEVKRKDLLRFIPNAKPRTYWKAVTTYCQDRKEIFLQLAEHLDVSKFPLEFLLGSLLTDPLTNYKLPKTRQFVVKAIFSDLSRLEDKIDTNNCFLLKILATDPNFSTIIDRNSIRIIADFLAKNFSTIVTKHEFLHLSKGDLLYLMRSPEVKSQESKWKAILKWIKSDPNLTYYRVASFRELFCTIRLDELSLTFLKEKIYPEQLVKRDVACMERLLGATIGIAGQLQSESVENEIFGAHPRSESPPETYTVLDAAREYADHLRLNSLDDPEPGSNQPSGSDGQFFDATPPGSSIRVISGHVSIRPPGSPERSFDSSTASTSGSPHAALPESPTKESDPTERSRLNAKRK